jgi:hypothetical protein
LTGDQHTDHIATGQQLSRHSLPTLLYFLFSPPHIFFNSILASRTNGTFGFARHTSRPFAKPKEPFFANAISGGEGVTVTMYNLDGNHPVWQNNVQMAPKQMKVIEQTNDKIVLRGYGHDAMGASFADYGLTIKLKNGELENCILHMHDRGVDIEYLP